MSKALFEAAAAGDLSKVETLLSHGAEIDWQHRGTGRTAIAEAALSGHTAVVRLLPSMGAVALPVFQHELVAVRESGNGLGHVKI